MLKTVKLVLVILLIVAILAMGLFLYLHFFTEPELIIEFKETNIVDFNEICNQLEYNSIISLGIL